MQDHYRPENVIKAVKEVGHLRGEGGDCEAVSNQIEELAFKKGRSM